MEKFIEKMVDVLDSEEEITAETILSDLEEHQERRQGCS